MERPQPEVRTLTDEQAEVADLIIDQLGLGEYADTELEMFGESGTLRYGLGRCWHHFSELSLPEIQAHVTAVLRDNGAIE